MISSSFNSIQTFIRSIALDSDARYAKIRASTSTTGLLQFGICRFEHDSLNNRLIASNTHTREASV